jgi:hypothetical protein
LPIEVDCNVFAITKESASDSRQSLTGHAHVRSFHPLLYRLAGRLLVRRSGQRDRGQGRFRRLGWLDWRPRRHRRDHRGFRG